MPRKSPAEEKRLKLAAREILQAEYQLFIQMHDTQHIRKDRAWIRSQIPPASCATGLMPYWIDVLNAAPRGCGHKDIPLIVAMAELQRDIAEMTKVAELAEDDKIIIEATKEKRFLLKEYTNLAVSLSKITNDPYNPDTAKVEKQQQIEEKPQNNADIPDPSALFGKATVQ